MRLMVDNLIVNVITIRFLLLMLFIFQQGHQAQGTSYLNLLNPTNIANTLRNMYGNGNGISTFSGPNTFINGPPNTFGNNMVTNGNGGYTYTFPINGNTFNTGNGNPYVATVAPPIIYNNGGGNGGNGPPIHRTRTRTRDNNNYEYEYFWEFGPDGKKRERFMVRGQPPNGFIPPGLQGGTGGQGQPITSNNNQPGNLPPGHRFNRPWHRGHRRPPNRPNWSDYPTYVNGNQPNIIINSQPGQPNIQSQPVQPSRPVQPVYVSTQTPTSYAPVNEVTKKPQRLPNRVVAGTEPPSSDSEDFVDSEDGESSGSVSTPSSLQGPLERASKVCGLTYNTRVVGGKEADPNQWIWMAALIRKNGNYCGGALITDQHILTAAHCLKGTTPREMFVRLGAYDFTDDASATSEDHDIETFNIHPQYDRYTHKNDIAILKMKNKAQFTHFIRPVCLPPKRRSYVNELATVVGWGSTDFGAPSSNKLREVTIPIWNNKDCSEAYKQNISANNLCAGFKEGGKDSCQGDSGGPLMLPGAKNKWTIVGIVSWGIRCGEPGYPGVYTRVNRYLDWLRMQF